MSGLRLKDNEVDVAIKDDDYEKALAGLQKRLQLLQTAYIVHGHRAIVVFEGWDAAGKGGSIRRLTECLDPRFVQVWPIAAPDEHELKRHYLYRFWRRLPGKAEMAVFDRSWYGRVLVERVEGLCGDAWKRAYDEISQFENLLTRDSIRIVKLFLHITQDEQDKRLRERLEVPYKRWKTGLDDYRNRARRAEYHQAIEDMLDKTSTREAPWRVIAANGKKHARLRSIETVLAALEPGVDLSDQPVDPALRKLAEDALGVKLRLD